MNGDHNDDDDNDDDEVLNDEVLNSFSAIRMKYIVEQGHIQWFMVNGSSGCVSGTGAGGDVINVRAGNAIRIDLKISGSPVPTVTWLKDHQPISPSNRVRLSHGLT